MKVLYNNVRTCTRAFFNFSKFDITNITSTDYQQVTALNDVILVILNAEKRAFSERNAFYYSSQYLARVVPMARTRERNGSYGGMGDTRVPR